MSRSRRAFLILKNPHPELNTQFPPSHITLIPPPLTHTYELIWSYFIQNPPRPTQKAHRNTETKIYMFLKIWLQGEFLWKWANPQKLYGLIGHTYGIRLKIKSLLAHVCFFLIKMISKMVWHGQLSPMTTEQIDSIEKDLIQAMVYPVGLATGITHQIVTENPTSKLSKFHLYWYIPSKVIQHFPHHIQPNKTGVA